MQDLPIGGTYYHPKRKNYPKNALLYTLPEEYAIFYLIESETMKTEEIFSIYNEEIASAGALIVGLSGGVDSVVMLHLLLEYTKSSLPQTKIIAAHFDHSTREGVSHKDAEFCKALATQLGIEYQQCCEDIPALVESEGGNFEQIARDRRRSFFADIAKQYNSALVFLAQHKDDQIETLLMRVRRSAGWRGLVGISPLTPLANNDPDSTARICRPLLNVSKKGIIAYAARRKLQWREDASNLECRYERNYLRNIMLPKIYELIPEADKALLALAATASETISDIDQHASKIVISEECGGVFLALTEGIEEAVFIREVDRVVQEKFSAKPLRRDSVEVLKKLFSGVAPAVQLAGGFIARAESDGYFILDPQHYLSTKEIKLGTLPFSYEDKILTISAEKVALNGKPADLTDKGTEYIMPLARGTNFTLRTVTKDERFKTFGQSRGRKVTDIFSDSKLPQRYRDSFMVLCAGKEQLLLPGVSTNPDYKISEFAGEAIHVQISAKYL